MMRSILFALLLLFPVGAFAQGNGCTSGVLTFTPINISAAGTVTLVAGVAKTHTYICKYTVQTTSANDIALVEGTGTNCSTVSAGLLGGTTSSTGQIVAANGNYTLGADALAWAKTATAADNVCLITSASTQVSGVIVTTQQ